jgi:biliverdin reductase
MTDVSSIALPLNVGLVGTGYAAKLRAETFQADPRSRLVAVVGHQPDKTAAFSHTYGAEAIDSWTALIERSDIDLVVIATVNRDHGAIAQAALQAGKHVVVEYPLSLHLAEAETLVHQAAQQKKLLHVEHVELLSGIHQTVQQTLAAIGNPFYASYTTFTAQRPAPQKWTYQADLFGFPLVGAVSRIHRLTDLLGPVTTVSCQARFWEIPDSFAYRSCLCTAQLHFANGAIADVTYGKGEAIWRSARTLEIHGEQGAILVDGEMGTLVQAHQTQSLDLGSRRGLFAKDTAMVLDHLIDDAPLYVSTASSLYALKVADAARLSAETGKTIGLD